MARWERAVDLRFHGPRFDGGALSVDVMSEIIAYKALVISVADALWRERHPQRERIEKGFQSSFELQMTGLRQGSALVQLERVRAEDQIALLPADDFDDGMKLIAEAIDAVGHDRSLPPHFPRGVLRRFGGLGKKLGKEEWLELVEPDASGGIRFDGERRQKLLSLVESRYEDTADEVGYVLATSVRKERFELYKTLDSAEPMEVPLPDAFEPLVLDVAREYESARVRVRGRAAFDAAGQLLRFVSVDAITRYGAEESGEVDNSSLFAAIDAIGDNVPDDEVARLPTDAAANVDAYLRRGAR